jgi:hypothetical protein
MEPSRRVDILVLLQLFELYPVVVFPKSVLLFINLEEDLVAYSYDNNYCNAMMFRNGQDDTDGTAPPVPCFTDDYRWGKLAERVDVDDDPLLYYVVDGEYVPYMKFGEFYDGD